MFLQRLERLVQEYEAKIQDERARIKDAKTVSQVQTCHMIRITRIRYGFLCFFLSDTAVLHFDTDFNKFYVDIILTTLCMRHKTTTQ